MVTVPEGEEPEVGVRYHAPMFVHCGIGLAVVRRERRGVVPTTVPGFETGAGRGCAGRLAGSAEQQQTLYGYATRRGPTACSSTRSRTAPCSRSLTLTRRAVSPTARL